MQPNLWTRMAFAAPGAVLALAGGALLLQAVRAWGAAEHVGLPAWLTTAGGVSLALPALLIGLAAAVSVWRYTRRPFAVVKLHLPFALALIGATYLVVMLAAGISDSATYDRLR